MAIKFVEKTPQEQGFARLWDVHVAPHLDYYARHYPRYSWLANGVALLMTAVFFTSIYFIFEYDKINPLGIMLNISVAAVLGVCALIGYVAYLPFKRLAAFSGDQLGRAIRQHFQNQFLPIADNTDLVEVAEFLEDENMTSSGSIDIGAAFQSADTTGLYRFFNCSYTTSNGKNRTVDHYLIVHMKLDVNVPEKIRIMPDRGLANGLVRLFTRRRNVRLSNAKFEKRFEVYSKDVELTHALLTPAVQQNFVDMQDYFSQGRSWLGGQCIITCMFEGDEMILCLEGLDDIAARQMAGKAPRKIVDAAHTAIKRLSQIPLIVHNLQDVMPQIRR